MSKIVNYRENFYVIKQLDKHIYRKNRYLKNINHIRSF